MANDRLDHIGKLRAVFAEVSAEPLTSSVTLDTFKSNTFPMACMATFAKCIEYNVAANHDSSLAISHAIMSAGLRGICEDLIALKYLLRFDHQIANDIVLATSVLEIHTGIERQRDFIYLNNPTQLFVGSSHSMSDIRSNVKASKEELKGLWNKTGATNRPSIKAMAEYIKLDSLYSYLYFAASNHVHHNIRTLFITAWGSKDGPTGFSSTNLSDYYHAFNSFYGALLYCGIVWSGLPIDVLGNHQDHAAKVEAVLRQVGWWPETITRDEMNIKRINLVEIITNMNMREKEPPAGLSIFDELKIPVS